MTLFLLAGLITREVRDIESHLPFLQTDFCGILILLMIGKWHFHSCANSKALDEKPDSSGRLQCAWRIVIFGYGSIFILCMVDALCGDNGYFFSRFPICEYDDDMGSLVIETYLAIAIMLLSCCIRFTGLVPDYILHNRAGSTTETFDSKKTS